MKKWLKILGALAACLGLGSCTDSDPYFFLNPKMPVSVPFALDKTGNKVSIDFWVLPKRQKLNETQMIGLRYKMSKDTMNLRELVHRTGMPLQVRLVSIDSSSEMPIALRGALAFVGNISADFGAVDNEIVYPSPYRHDGIDQEDIVALFRPTHYGRYRAEVSTLKDNVDLKSAHFELYVSGYFGGK